MLAGIAVAIKVGNSSSRNLPVGMAELSKQAAAFNFRNRKNLQSVCECLGSARQQQQALLSPCTHRNQGQGRTGVTYVAPPALPRL